MVEDIPFSCPEKGCAHSLLLANERGLYCQNGHFFEYAEGTLIPIFSRTAEDKNEYTQACAAEIYDNALSWLFATFKTDEATLRKNLLFRLNVKKGDSVLVTGAGTGSDLPYLALLLQGEGIIHAQDISAQMLTAGALRHKAALSSAGVKAHFSVGDATQLPYGDGLFDAAYHFGGINLYSDIKLGIMEMVRVVKPGGRIVIGDEGLAPWLKTTEFGKILIKNNQLYEYDPPLTLLPETAVDVKLSWELSNCFYVIEFVNAKDKLQVNMDVPHKGRRGGSLRTRYFGQLEGVAPDLRDAFYADAEKRGISRVEYIETALRALLEKES